MKRTRRHRRQTQLDRIERKLDELLARPPVAISTNPINWIVPGIRSTEGFGNRKPEPPSDPWGNPIAY